MAAVSVGQADDHLAPDYGLDAPGVVRNLWIAAGLGLALATLVRLRVVPQGLTWRIRPDLSVGIGLLGLGLGPGIGCAATAAAMMWSSRLGKLRQREQLLDAVPWTGAEAVLDVGCGRGLMLIGAARRLRSGYAVGIDLWRTEDLSGNRADATVANAVAERVDDLVSVQTADMRRLPFPDHSFDRIVSCAAIHNIADADGRAQAIWEITRVLRPGGYAIIDDIRHLGEYLATFRAAGCVPVRRLDSAFVALVWTLLTCGSLRPGAWLVQRPEGTGA